MQNRSNAFYNLHLFLFPIFLYLKNDERSIISDSDQRFVFEFVQSYLVYIEPIEKKTPKSRQLKRIFEACLHENPVFRISVYKSNFVDVLFVWRDG